MAGDNSTLTKPQFYSTLRLISLAQARMHSNITNESRYLLGSPMPADVRCASGLRALPSAVQRSGGLLPEALARSLLVGIGPVPPPPTMAGMLHGLLTKICTFCCYQDLDDASSAFVNAVYGPCTREVLEGKGVLSCHQCQQVIEA